MEMKEKCLKNGLKNVYERLQEKTKDYLDLRTLITLLIGSFLMFIITEVYHSVRHRADYRLGYKVVTEPYMLEKKEFLSKKPYPATRVVITISNYGQKTQRNVGLHVAFNKTILYTYAPTSLLQIYDKKGNSLAGNIEAFMKESGAVLNIAAIPSNISVPISFVLDHEYSKDKAKGIINFVSLTSEEN